MKECKTSLNNFEWQKKSIERVIKELSKQLRRKKRLDKIKRIMENEG